MKSETYQKEGWFILEDNSLLGSVAENTAEDQSNENIGLLINKSSDSKSSVDNSANELTEFIECLTQDTQEPTQSEIDSGIEKILERANQTEEHKEIGKNNIKKKIALKVLLIAAMLSVFSISCLCVIGTNNNISIENGFVTFAKDTVRVVFFGEEQYISAQTLLIDLENNGFGDILFPEEFIIKSDEYKVSAPRYSNIGVKQVGFNIYRGEMQYSFTIFEEGLSGKENNFVGLEDAENIVVENSNIYVFDFGDLVTAKFEHNGLCYDISSQCTYQDMIKIVESIK